MDKRLEILEAREKRFLRVKSAFEDSSLFLIVIKANICGNDKNILEANIVLKYFLSALFSKFNVSSYESFTSADGSYYFVRIFDDNVFTVKKVLVELESGVYGRFIDLDLHVNSGPSISRVDFGFEKRKCLICNDDYSYCMREKRHSVQEVVMYTRKKLRELLVSDILEIVESALIDEVSAEMKFGLVTKTTSGVHNDMDYDLFLKSIEALMPYFKLYVEEGFVMDDDSFKRLRSIGVRAEKAMFEATGGVNTHKGLIFLLGALLPIVVKVIYHKLDFLDISMQVKEFTKPVLNDFIALSDKTFLTKGEEAYLSYQMLGVRGEVTNGLQLAFHATESFNLEEDHLVLKLLLFMMERLDDTVILHRGKLDSLAYVQSVAKKLNEFFDLEEVSKYHLKFLEKGLSPGGSADMVVVSLVLMNLKNKYFI